jgi:hypothetical protein
MRNAYRSLPGSRQAEHPSAYVQDVVNPCLLGVSKLHCDARLVPCGAGKTPCCDRGTAGQEIARRARLSTRYMARERPQRAQCVVGTQQGRTSAQLPYGATDSARSQHSQEATPGRQLISSPQHMNEQTRRAACSVQSHECVAGGAAARRAAHESRTAQRSPATLSKLPTLN